MLRKGLTENHLEPEAAAERLHESKKSVSERELMSGVGIDDFLGSEMAKTRM